MADANSNDLMEKLVSLCKRRGFIYPSSEIYGGINGFWDYGPLGVELKRHIKDAWWTDVVVKRDDIVGLDSTIIMNPKVWEASGHLGGFADPMQTCRQCKKLFRADQVWEMLRDSEWVRSLAEVLSVTRWDELLEFDSVKGSSGHIAGARSPRRAWRWCAIQVSPCLGSRKTWRRSREALFNPRPSSVLGDGTEIANGTGHALP